MIIKVKHYGENEVIISLGDLQKLVEVARKIEPIEITFNRSAEKIKLNGREFENSFK